VSEVFLETKGVGKEFNGVWVLNEIDFDLKKGEIHALVGENGAGKSTFIKILSGVHNPSQGQLILNGKEKKFPNVQASENAGIRTVHQEINLVSYFNVYQNIFVGAEIQKRYFGFPVLANKMMKNEVEKALGNLNIQLDPKLPAHTLDTSHQRIVEICKALVHNPQVMIFDEPTTSLTEEERNRVLAVIEDLKENLGIIFVSHNLEEVFRLADRITIFRDGKKIATKRKEETSQDEVIAMMIGGEKTFSKYKRQQCYVQEASCLELKNVSNEKLNDVNFKICKGEVIGIVGVLGSGKTEIAKAIFGLDKIKDGEICLNGKKINPTPQKSVKQGIALVPEERQEQGLVSGMSVTKNITIAYLDQWVKNGVISHKRERETAREKIELLGIRTTGPDQIVRYLSGGNQQKVILSRWLSGDFQVGIFDEATKGIDIKAKEDIYQLIDKLAEEGKGVIFLSSYLPEVLLVADKILVLRNGAIVGEFSPDEEQAEEKILSRMLGGSGYERAN